MVCLWWDSGVLGQKGDMDIKPLGLSLCDQEEFGQQLSWNELHRGPGREGRTRRAEHTEPQSWE